MELRDETTSRKEDGKCVNNVGEIPGKCIVLETKEGSSLEEKPRQSDS